MQAEAARAAASTVVSALQKASAATGVDFNYLLGTAIRESGLKPQAKAGTSSATGLFQFIEQTWLGLVKDHGAKHGLGSFAGAITKTADGRYRVANPDDRNAILQMRNDPQISALMAGEYTRKTQTEMEGSLGRKVSAGELYAGHLLGSASACKLIRSAGGSPDAAACDLFPKAAGANRNVFYHADGSPKSVREVYNWTVGHMTGMPKIDMPKPTGTSLEGLPSLRSGVLADTDPAQMLAAMWNPNRRGFFSSDESNTSAAPFAMSSAILDVLQAVAKDRGSR